MTVPPPPRHNTLELAKWPLETIVVAWNSREYNITIYCVALFRYVYYNNYIVAGERIFFLFFPRSPVKQYYYSQWKAHNIRGILTDDPSPPEGGRKLRSYT